MKIAYVTYEFPPDTAFGGIATYAAQVALMMHGRGHVVEVFCASEERTVSEEYQGVLVHRICCLRGEFPEKVLAIFKERHQLTEFDVVESPEYNGDAYYLKKAFPEIPLVVKLHTPSFLINELNQRHKTGTLNKIKLLLRAITSGKVREGYWMSVINRIGKKNAQHAVTGADLEYEVTRIADEVHSPSVSLGAIVQERWNLDPSLVFHVPNVFTPAPALLNLPVDADTKIVTYLGRLETRKGIVELVRAIPAVCRAVPGVKFRLVGQSFYSILPGVSMHDYIRLELKDYLSNIEFAQVKSGQLPQVFADSAVCVLPSIWENFPNTCLEAMSAGRAVVASVHGGMKDMLEEPPAGVLVDPADPAALSQAIIRLLQDKEQRLQFGAVARQKVLTAYNQEVIGSLLEKRYSETITRCREKQ